MLICRYALCFHFDRNLIDQEQKRHMTVINILCQVRTQLQVLEPEHPQETGMKNITEDKLPQLIKPEVIPQHEVPGDSAIPGKLEMTLVEKALCDSQSDQRTLQSR